MAVLELPSNVEAERSVLGSMLLFPESASIVIGTLGEEDFSDADPRNGLIFKAICELYSRKLPIDAQTLINQLKIMKLDKAVDSAYIIELVNTTITADHVETYIDLVKEQSLLRSLLLKVSEIQKKYGEGVENISEFISKSNDEITAIAQKRSVGKMETARKVAETTYEKILKTSQVASNSLTGVNTGYYKLNDYTHGWQKGELIIIAARPGMGKTAFALNLAVNAALKDKIPVAFFSLEMSKEKIMERILSSRSKVPSGKLATGFGLSREDKVMLKAARDEISNTMLYFDDVPDSKLGDLVAKATRLKNQHPDLGLIVIDYLSRIKLSDKVSTDSSRTNEVGVITSALKSLSRNLNLPVICLAQLNRNVEQGDTKVPALSHLRESGNIEQDADMVLMLYREDYYTSVGQSVKPKKWMKNGEQEQQKEEKPKKEEENNVTSDTLVLIAKNRNGQTGKIHLLFQKDISLFMEPTPAYLEKQAKYEEDYGE